MLWLFLPALLGLIAAVLVVVLVLQSIANRGPKSLVGTHAIVTGGSSGIGKSAAKYLAQKGANLTLFARDLSRLEATKSEILSKYPSVKVECVSIDVSKSYEEVEDVVCKAVDILGPVKILINCAGTSISAKVEDTKMEDFRKMMDVNYFGTVSVTKACVPYLKETGGCIVLTSSVAGLMGLYGFSAYSASKFALRGFAESLAMELKPYNVFVTLNCPPDTDTPGFAEEEKTKPDITRSLSESGGLMSPDVVAKGLVDDMFQGKFLSTYGFEANLVKLVCSGMSPVVSFGQLLLEVHLMGVVRLIAFFILRNFDSIVKKGVEKETKEQTTKKLE